MTNLERLKLLAQNALDATERNPLSKVLTLVPVVQVYSETFINDFPVKFRYLGVNSKGHHVYNLDALSVVQTLTRAELEFNIDISKTR